MKAWKLSATIYDQEIVLVHLLLLYMSTRKNSSFVSGQYQTKTEVYEQNRKY